MLLTLWVNALKSRMAAPGGRGLTVLDIPKVARDELGLSGLVMTTELLAGADRTMLSRVHEAADKAHCPILVLSESRPLPLASRDPDVLAQAVERCHRIAQAANWLQCAAFSICVACKTDEDLAQAAANLKAVSRRAEKLELNMCIAPGRDMTADADKVSELLRKIGGFRVGTLPDLSAAMASANCDNYVRRLAPYASAMIFSAEELLNAGGNPTAASRAAKAAKSIMAELQAAAAAGTLPTGTELAAGPETGSGSDATAKKSRAKKNGAVDGTDGPKPANGAKPAAGKPTAGKGKASAVAGSGTVAEVIKVLQAVGYDQSIALDFRGSGDPIPSLLAARDVLMAKLGLNAEDDDVDDDPLAALLAGEDEPVPDSAVEDVDDK